MAELEVEAKAQADAQRQAQREKEEALVREGQKRRGPKPKEPDDKPKPEAQRNFTDPESRIMKDGASKSFEQAYNCQAVVDETAQVIVATNVTQESNDKKQVKPLIENLKQNTGGEKPSKASADSGRISDSAKANKVRPATSARATSPIFKTKKSTPGFGESGYIATGRLKHSEQPPPAPRGRIPKSATTKERMARKLRTVKGRGTYKKRKHIVEPVFGQIKEGRGFRRFLLRGIENVSAEWDLICLTHNLLKLFRSGFAPQTA